MDLPSHQALHGGMKAVVRHMKQHAGFHISNRIGIVSDHSHVCEYQTVTQHNKKVQSHKARPKCISPEGRITALVGHNFHKLCDVLGVSSSHFEGLCCESDKLFEVR